MSGYVIVYDSRRWVRSDSTDTTVLLPDAALTSNVALLDRDAQVFTGTYNQFVQAGIGRSPQARLHVGAGGTGTQEEKILIDSGSGGGGDSYLSLARNGASTVFIGRGGAAGSFITGSLVDDLNIRSDSHNINFSTSSASIQMLLNTSGKLGIGGTPTATLHVTGAGGATVDAIVTGRMRTGDAGNAGGVWLNAAQTLFIGQQDATHCGFFTGGGNWALLADTSQNVFLHGTGVALATSAANGFTSLPNMAGIPTGVPTSMTGATPVVIDTADNRLYFYNGGWQTPTAAAPDMATSVLAPAGSETIAASTSAVIARSYTIASAQKLTIGSGARVRIL